MMRRGFSEAGPVAVSRRLLLAAKTSSYALTLQASTAASFYPDVTARTDDGGDAPKPPQLVLGGASPLAAVMGAWSNHAPFKPTRPWAFVHDAELVRAKYQLIADNDAREFLAGFDEAERGNTDGSAPDPSLSHSPPASASSTAPTSAAAAPPSVAATSHPSPSSSSFAGRTSQEPTTGVPRNGARHPWAMRNGAASDESQYDDLVHAIAADIYDLKRPDMSRRPAWQPPSAPSPKDCDSLIERVRAIAFPEFHTPACDTAGGTNWLGHRFAGGSDGAAVVGPDADCAALRCQIRGLTRTIVNLLQPSLIIDALEDGTDCLRADDPSHFHQSKLGAQVRRLTRAEAVTLADNHAHNVVVPAFLRHLRNVVRCLNADVDAALKQDVATTSRAEVALTYPGVRALLYHRTAHALLHAGAPLLFCRLISERAHGVTGIDIHPGVTIGPGCFIDHGTGLVIGGTAEIGANVCLFHGVTLGSRAFPTDAQGRRIKNQKRHPIIKDNVNIYAGATLLGRITVGEGATIASGVTVVKDVEPGTTIAAARAPHTIVPPKHA